MPALLLICAAGPVLQFVLPLLSWPAGLVVSAPIAAAGAYAVVGMLRRVRECRGAQRIGWALGAAACFGLAVSYAVYTVYGLRGGSPASPNLADLCSLAAATLAVPAIALSAPVDRSRLARTTRLIDVVTVTGALFALAWQHVIGPAAAAVAPDARMLFIMTMVPEIIAAALALVLAARVRPEEHGYSLHLLSGGMGVFAVAAVGAVYNRTHGEDWHSHGLGALYLIAAGMIALSSRAKLAPSGVPSRPVLSGFWTVLPYLPVLLAIVGVASEFLRTGTLSPVLMWVVLTTSLLAMLRQFLTLMVVRGLVADLDEQRRHLDHQAHHDSLTGLPNRAAFHQRAGEAVGAAGPDDRTGVLMLDLDGFKPVNDTHGHAAGDAVLVEVGRRIPRALRDIDVAARLGGDEFAVLLPHLSTPEDAEAVAFRILAEFAEPVTVNGIALRIGGTVGITVVTGAAVELDRLLQQADAALYAAKAAGKGCVHRYRVEEGAAEVCPVSPPNREFAPNPA